MNENTSMINVVHRASPCELVVAIVTLSGGNVPEAGGFERGREKAFGGA